MTWIKIEENLVNTDNFAVIFVKKFAHCENTYFLSGLVGGIHGEVILMKGTQEECEEALEDIKCELEESEDYD